MFGKDILCFFKDVTEFLFAFSDKLLKDDSTILLLSFNPIPPYFSRSVPSPPLFLLITSLSNKSIEYSC